MSHPVTELVIEAGHTERNYWRDLFRYRELFYFLAWRDVLVRYKQTVIGILVGGAAPASHDGSAYFRFQPHREIAGGRHALSRDGLAASCHGNCLPLH